MLCWAALVVCALPAVADTYPSFPTYTPTAEDIANANQYVQRGQWPQPGGLGTPITLTYSYQNMFDGALRGPDNASNPQPLPLGAPLPASLIRQSIEGAMGLWASVAPINFVEVPDNGLPYGDLNATYGQIRIRHVYINGPDPILGDPVAKAQAYFPGGGSVYDGDIEFDESDPWQNIGTTKVPDMYGAATHELGHVLGLDHTNVSNAVMYWIFRRFQGPGTGYLTPVDVAGVWSNYGQGTGSVHALVVVPEPATWVLMAMGAIAIASRFAKRRRASRDGSAI